MASAGKAAKRAILVPPGLRGLPEFRDLLDHKEQPGFRDLLDHKDLLVQWALLERPELLVPQELLDQSGPPVLLALRALWGSPARKELRDHRVRKDPKGLRDQPERQRLVPTPILPTQG